MRKIPFENRRQRGEKFGASISVFHIDGRSARSYKLCVHRASRKDTFSPDAVIFEQVGLQAALAGGRRRPGS